MALFPVLSLLAAAVQAPAEAGQCVPLALSADYRPAVTVEIEGFGPARFLIDTGASNTALARSVVEALNAQDVTAREVITLTELFATGTVDVSLSVFPGEAREVEAVIVESDLEESSTILGLLGADFFSGDTIDMDFSRGALCITDDDEMARKIRDAGRFMTALYVGGMGAKGKNFYNNIFRKYGYEQEAEQIQDLYLDGKKDEAMALVPQDYLDATALVGDESFVRERVEAYRAAGVTHLQISPTGPNPMADIEKVKSWVS